MGPYLEGPVPTIFSSEPAKTKKTLNNSPQYAYDCMQALLSRLVERQELTVMEAEAYLSDPAPGVVTRPFVHPWPASVTAKPTSEPQDKPKKPSSKEKGK